MTGNFAKSFTTLDDVQRYFYYYYYYYYCYWYFLQRPPWFKKNRIQQALKPLLWFLSSRHERLPTAFGLEPFGYSCPACCYTDPLVPKSSRVNGPTCFAKATLTNPRSRQQLLTANRARHSVQRGGLWAARDTTNLRRVARSQPTPPAPYGTMFGTITGFQRVTWWQASIKTVQSLRIEPSLRKKAWWEKTRDQPINLPATTIMHNIRRSRKGTAPGPSSLTADSLRLLLAVNHLAPYRRATAR